MAIGVLEKKRLHGLDTLRGIMMIQVMLFHLFFDLTEFYSVHIPGFWDWQGTAWRIFMTGSLMLISGVSCALSRSNKRRGVKTVGIAIALTLFTMLFMQGMEIYFGILHFFGVMMLLWIPMEPVLKKIPPNWGVVGCLALFVLCYPIPLRYYAIPGLFWLGLPVMGFVSVDYYPLLPWGFLFLAGGFLGLLFQKKGFPKVLYQMQCPPLEWIGRYTLPLYLLHQPLLVGALMLLNLQFPFAQ